MVDTVGRDKTVCFQGVPSLTRRRHTTTVNSLGTSSVEIQIKLYGIIEQKVTDFIMTSQEW